MPGFLDMWHYGFVQRAVLAGVLVAVGCGMLGVFLVLRRYAMIGDGLAHCAFGAVGLALFLDRAPLAVTLPLVAGASLLILYLPGHSSLFGDAAIGMVSALGVAVGVLLASMGGGFNVDLFGFLFGDILAVGRGEVWLSLLLTLAIVGIIVLMYHDLFALTFDEETARVWGIHPERVNRLLAVLTGILVVLGIRIAGTLLISSLLIFPAVTALQCCRGFRSLLIMAALLGGVSVFLGLVASLWLDAPAGAAIVMVNAVLFVMALLVSKGLG